jgi:hypothetical protein
MIQATPVHSGDPHAVEHFIYENLAAVAWMRLVEGKYEILNLGSGLLAIVDGVYCVATVGHNLKQPRMPDLLGPFPSAVTPEQILYKNADLQTMVGHVFRSDDPDFGCIVLNNPKVYERMGKKFVDLSDRKEQKPTVGQDAVVSGVPWGLGTDLDPKDHGGLTTRSHLVLHSKTTVSAVEADSFLIHKGDGWPEGLEADGMSGGPVYIKLNPALTSYALAGLEVSVTKERDALRVLPISRWISWARQQFTAEGVR